VREYGGDIHFICLEAENLATKRFSFKVFFIAPWSLFSNKAFILDIYLWCHVLWRFNHNYVEP